MKKILAVVALFTLAGCGSGSSSGSSGGSGATYYAVNRNASGSAFATNGPFHSLNACQEFLASSEGRMPAWRGASCEQTEYRP